jgi:translation initiation factor IF-2
LSTRVHELAKKLGLKSQDLIERIQQEGLDVKPSPLASLDSAVVERIEQLFQPGTARPASAPRAAPAPARTVPSEATSLARAELAPHPTPTSQPQVRMPESAPPAHTSAPPGPAAESIPSAAGGGPRPVPEPAGARPSSGPLSAFARSGGLTAAPRGAGPLAGHTPHRGALGPAGSGTARPGAPGSAPVSAQGPLRRSDYISPAGTRPVPPSGTGRPATLPPGPARRPGESPEPQRREPSGPARPAGRPLPPLAASPTFNPATARPAPRPAAPEGKTQRPDVKFTPAQLAEMARTGRLPNQGQPGRPGAPAPRIALPPGLRPMGPAAGPMPALPTGPAGDTETEERPARGHGRPGSAADRAGRRAERSKRAAADRGKGLSSPLPASALLEGEEEAGRARRGPRRGGKGHRGAAVIAPRKTEAQIETPITVRSLSEALGIKASDLLRKLWFTLGPDAGVNINSTLAEETAVELAMEFGVELQVLRERTAEDEMLEAFEEADQDEAGLSLRPPVVTILGHVDHGKTSLLDRIRRSNVVASESGGITQHIGAYQVEHNGRKIAFVDTPGHEAFTAMRARGANVTDIVVLVVAADDGVMPQTVEAIAHAKAAEVPVVVALNKIDLPNAEAQSNITKIYGELAQQGLNPSEWGGETEVVRTSASTGQGIPKLLETLETLAELHELKANPDRPARGTCLEAAISEGRGVVATVLVQEGTLRVGDALVCGDGYGRVRALFDDQGRAVTEAGPSTPVEISGLDEVPTAGEAFAVVADIGRAREIAEGRRARGRGASLVERQAVTLENIFTKMAEQKVKSLNLILKADVQGSIEALTKELEKLKNDEVPIRILLKAVGGITESDVSLAEASAAIIIGFRVAPEERALGLAEEKQVEIRRYDVIYQVTDEVKKAVEGLLVPEVKEVHLGAAKVQQVFKISKVGTVAGCIVTRGTIERAAKARIFREGREIYKGTIEALKRFKEDVKEVREGFECGIKIGNFDDIKPDDIIEAFRVDVIRRTL